MAQAAVTDIVLPPDIDVDLIPLLHIVNRHPDFKTTNSCGGHYNVCIARKLTIVDKYGKEHDAKWFDDEVLSDTESVSHNNDSLFCSGSTGPDLMFQYRSDNALMSAFMARLQQLPPGVQYGVFDDEKSANAWRHCTYLYDKEHGCEVWFPSIKEQITTQPGFKAFWQHFADSWNKIVGILDDRLHIAQYQLPQRFHIKNSRCRCHVRKRKHKQPQVTLVNKPENQWLHLQRLAKPDLFLEDIAIDIWS